MLGQILQCNYQGDDAPYTDEEHTTLKFVNNCLYLHKVLCINYTSYDMKQEQDSLNPCTHANIMMLLYNDNSNRHSYWYVHIIGLFHVIFCHPSSINPLKFDVVQVCWYGKDPDSRYHSGWRTHCLPQVGFVEYTKDDSSSPAFGFVNPEHIIQGVHLIPAFHHGVTNKLLPPWNSSHLPSEGDVDFNFFYVNM